MSEDNTKALVTTTKDTLDVLKEEIVASSKENCINGAPLNDFIYHHFLNRIDPVEYCEDILRGHLPLKQQKLHENQTALIRAVCNPNIKQVAGMMSRQCLVRGSIIHTRDGKLLPIEHAYEYEAHETIKEADILRIKTSNGAICYATDNHPFFTDEGWKEASTLSPRNQIYCLKYFDKFGDGIDKLYVAKLLGLVLIEHVNEGNLFDRVHNYMSDFKEYLNEFDKNIIPQMFTAEERKENIKGTSDKIKAFYRYCEIKKYGIPYLTNQFNKEEILAFVKQLLKTYMVNNCIIVRNNIHFAEWLRELLNKLGFNQVTVQSMAQGSGIVWQLKIFDNSVQRLENWLATDTLEFDSVGCIVEDDGEVLEPQQVVSIVREQDKQSVWDITILDKGWFICCGMKVHNSGKCLAKGTLVLMADGTKKAVEDIIVGDKVMSPTGEARTVLSLGHGYEEMFEIKSKEYDESFTVNKSHILSLKRRHKVENISVKDYVKLSETDKTRYHQYKAVIEYPVKQISIIPYDYGFGYAKQLINYNRISEEILKNNSDIRKQFLAGMVDSDYCLVKRNKSKYKLEFKVAFQDIANDIVDLVRSVGLRACCKQKKRQNVLEPYFKVYIYGNLGILPCRERLLPFVEDDLLFDINVFSKGQGEYFGFTIDGDDHLFVLGNYTVTHNTESIASFSGFLIDNYPQMRIGIFTPRLQQAEISIGRLSTFFQMNEDKLNHKITKITKDKIELDNGSFVTAVSASDQSNIEGLTFDVICLDEAQKVSDYTFSERIVNIWNITNSSKRVEKLARRIYA